MNDIVIDLIATDDLPTLHTLYEELTGEACDLEAMRSGFAAMAANPDYILYAARSEGVLVGSVMGVVCRKLTRDCRPFLLMENFIVAASQRRKGVGRLLLDRIEQSAIAHGCGSVMFVSSVRRPDAHAFYASMGYALNEVQGFRKKFPPERPPVPAK